MLKFIFTTATLLVLSLSAKADYLTINCTSNSASDRELLLFIANQDVKQVRIQANGSRPTAIMVTRLAVQNSQGVTLYTTNVASAGLFEVENEVLEGMPGSVRFNNDSFYCID